MNKSYIDGLMHERRYSRAFAMELRLSCINPSIYSFPSKPMQNKSQHTRVHILWGKMSHMSSTSQGISTIGNGYDLKGNNGAKRRII